jgi:predicted phage terminase large subunit-like protein
MTPSEIADNRLDLLTFTSTMFKSRKGVDLKHNWHQDKICEALEKVVIGRVKRLIINIPPRSGKTEIAVINFMAWAMGNFPDSEFIHASYSKRLATANSYATRAIMQHEKYGEIFGNIGLSSDSKAKDEFRTNSGGIVYATGANGTITGYGAGKMRDTFGGAIIIDDPHKADESNSVVMRQNVIDWFQNTMESRKNSSDTPIILIMQRLHENDLTGFLLEGGNGEHWDNVCIPALTDDDVSFWPEQFLSENLYRMRSASPYIFAGQYLQRPSPIGGGLFRDEWWKYYTIEPKLKWRAIYADTAQKTKEANDFSVFACWGESDDGRAVLIDVLRGKWEAPELIIQAKAFWRKHVQNKNGKLRAMKVEDKASGTALIQTIKRDGGIPIIAVQRNIDKITRAMDASPMIESGNVILPQDAPFLSEFLQEHSGFPNAIHDDMVDTTCDAVTDILTSSFNAAAKGVRVGR